VVDHGRPRSRNLGVPVVGAADRFSLALGNALVGNGPDTAALEIGLLGPTLQADAPLACVVHGAPFALRSDRQDVSAGTTFTLQPGERLHIGGTPRRARAYFCVRGGIAGPLVLGSRSSLAPLQAGERLTCRRGTIGRRSIDNTLLEEATGKLRILPGAQADWFPPNVLTQDAPQFEVTAASNRMGLRLLGAALPVPAREMVSEPVCPGTVQVTRDGQCILLGIDGQTIGGYPQIAHVIRADLDALGQLRPGERICFEQVTIEQAEDLYRRRAEQLREWLTRLAVAP
jgi:biotin-dependent carboxylase-like uncharacterized protein